MGGYEPSDVANEALDTIGWPEVLGDLEDGSPHAQILLRKWSPCLQQMLRAANWQFARKEAPMLMLADASGNTPNVGSVVPRGWQYEYALPEDAMRIRFIPSNPFNSAVPVPSGNIQLPQNVPLTTGVDQMPGQLMRQRPARFLIATDYNYPPMAGQGQTLGVSPQGRTVVLTNVNQATAVYTALMLFPAVWDALFRSAIVAYLACEIAVPLWSRKDKVQIGMQMREEQIAITKSKVTEARLVDGNAGISSADLRTDWIDTRRDAGLWAGPAWGGMPGGNWGGSEGAWDSLPINGTSAF